MLPGCGEQNEQDHEENETEPRSDLLGPGAIARR